MARPPKPGDVTDGCKPLTWPNPTELNKRGISASTKTAREAGIERCAALLWRNVLPPFTTLSYSSGTVVAGLIIGGAIIRRTVMGAPHVYDFRSLGKRGDARGIVENCQPPMVKRLGIEIIPGEPGPTPEDSKGCRHPAIRRRKR